MTNHLSLPAALKRAVGSTENAHQPASTNTVGAVLVFFCLLFPGLQAWATDEYEEGFLTAYLNRGLERVMAPDTATHTQKLQYGRDVTRFVSAPKFGGYVVGKYEWSGKAGSHHGGGFSCRLVRAYLSGSILRDFKYRVQMELRNASPAMRDYTLEWVHWKEFQVKVGQFKRGFTYENPSNPWDVGFGSYALVAQAMTAMAGEDCSGEAAQNGRDQGLQVQGDLLPISADRHALLHYQAAVYNGNGQNKGDNDGRKDWMGSIWIQPIKGLHITLFGWHGSYTKVVSTGKNLTVGRDRWGLSAKFDRKDWSARAEYAHSTGHNINAYDVENKVFTDRGKADGWYVALGAPCTKWLKIYARYDTFRKQASWGSSKTLYSLAPNFQLHRNLMFQLQYNYVCDRLAQKRHYNEFWAQSYVRF